MCCARSLPFFFFSIELIMIPQDFFESTLRRQLQNLTTRGRGTRDIHGRGFTASSFTRGNSAGALKQLLGGAPQPQTPMMVPSLPSAAERKREIILPLSTETRKGRNCFIAPPSCIQDGCRNWYSRKSGCGHRLKFLRKASH